MQTLAPVLAMAAANSNNIYIAVADRTGIERNHPFPGRSLIVEPSGIPLAGPIDLDEKIIYADCDFANVRKHQYNQYNSLIKDRRIDVYDELLGYKK